MAKVRVYELAKEFGVESKVIMAKLQELGEFVRSASSTIEAPVVRKLVASLQESSDLKSKQEELAWTRFEGEKTGNEKGEREQEEYTWNAKRANAYAWNAERANAEAQREISEWNIERLHEEAIAEDAEREIERLHEEAIAEDFEREDAEWISEETKQEIVAGSGFADGFQRSFLLPLQVPYAIPCWQVGAAVLVGVSKPVNLPPKLAITNNIASLSVLLRDGFGVPESNIRTLENPEHSTQVHEEIDAAMDSVDPVNGGLFVYYAGHGWTDSQTGRLLLSLTKSNPAKSYTALKFDDIRNQIADSNIPVRLVVLDSCYSGAALDSLSGDIASSTAIEGTYVMTSSSATVRSRALDTDRYTTFTGELINALVHGVPNASEIITASAAFRYIKGVCRQRGWPEPHRMARNDGAELPLMRNSWNGNEWE